MTRDRSQAKQTDILKLCPIQRQAEAAQPVEIGIKRWIIGLPLRWSG